MIFFQNRQRKAFSKNHIQIISLLEQGDIQTIEQLLYQPDNKRIEYLPITFEMLSKFKKPLNSTQTLSIYETIDKGKYQLIIFEIPWLDKDLKYSPIIFDIIKSKIVGVMLTFNELYEYLSKKQNSDISKLGAEWTGFIISKQFGI